MFEFLTARNIIIMTFLTLFVALSMYVEDRWRKARKNINKPKKEPERYFIPENDIETFYGLYDHYLKKRTHESNYRLWKFLKRICPECAQPTKSFVINTRCILQPMLEEVCNDTSDN